MDSIRIHPLDTDQDVFESLYEIYQIAFPLSEQKSKETLQKLLSHPEYSIFALYTDDTMAGFTIYFRPLQSGFYLLEYMAVDPLKRSGGLGRELFIGSLNVLMERYGEKILLIEIDAPDPASDSDSQEHRRERFYRRAGCRKIEGFDYILGLETPFTPPPMQLMLYSPFPQTAITRDELRHHVETMYEKVYGRSRNDPHINTMFRDIAEHLPLH